MTCRCLSSGRWVVLQRREERKWRGQHSIITRLLLQSPLPAG
jgi:hypothetical protein